MPDFLGIASVEPDFDALPEALRVRLESYPDPYDDCATWTTLREALTEVAEEAPDLDVRVLYRAHNHWLELAAMGIRANEVWDDWLGLSFSPNAHEPAPSLCAPDEPLFLDVPADRLLDLVGGRAEVDPAGQGTRLFLRFEYSSADEALRALSIAAAHLERTPPPFVLEVAEEFFAAELERGHGVTLRPLFVWHADAALRAAAQRAFPQKNQRPLFRAAEAAPDLAAFDEQRPLVTGSAARRQTAALEMMPWFSRKESGGFGINPSVRPTSPTLLEALVAGARAAENEDARFDEVRIALYGYIGEFELEEATRALLDALDAERTPTARRALYAQLARRPGVATARALVKGYRTDVELRQSIGEYVWKHEEAVELLVREDLLAAWSTDRAYAKTILALLREEYIRVPEPWIAGGDEKLRKALGSLVTSGA